MPKPITVLVAGATGRQGGAVARLLLDRGHHVRALTRRPSCRAAASLHVLGADVYEGDLDSMSSVKHAAEGADAFFLMATPFEEGVQAEVRQAHNAAKAAKDAGVEHIVYSSVAGADQSTGNPHFESKRKVETYIRGMGPSYTIVAPVFFMENLLDPTFRQGLRAGKLWMPLRPTRSLQMVAVADIAGLVRLVLERPTEFQAKRIEIASDSLTGPEMARTLTKATGIEIDYAEAALSAVRSQSEDLARTWEWLDRVGYNCDIDSLRQVYPDVGWHDFGRWAREQDWSVIGAARSEQPPA